MKVNEKLYGFTVTRIRPIDELNGELVEMVHNKTGLELVWINRDEENKTFGIAFETLPSDDTGVFHILEHSVLCGSDKYPVKEPFVDLLKTSMNTFLNAMTFQDKTLYPVSSRNDKDFFNLMSVYLDAVFCPSIYNKPEIFYQEGWHYELDENGEASYKGVVFNEMKGALANAEELGDVAINRAIFPDSPYRFNSGGDPANIPDLTYNDFINNHMKFYSPSNAYVYFDGSVDIEKALEMLDTQYLANMERGERLAPPVKQEPVDGGVCEVEYELGEEEDEENKTRISWANVIGMFDEREKLIAMQVIADALCGSNQSILTKKVLAKGLAEDVSMQVIDGIYQPWVKIDAQNIVDGKQEELEKLIFGELKRLAVEGIDKSQLEASMASIEFQLRERDFGSFPQGIIFGFLLLETWLYGGDPIDDLIVGDVFDRLKEKMADGYFEKLISEIFIENNHKAKVVLVPSKTAGEKRRAKELERIKNETSLWSEQDRAELAEKQEKLLEWQNSEDSDEARAKLPLLSLDDISTKPEALPTQVEQCGNITALYHNISTSQILYYNLYFDADDLTAEEVSYLSFLTDVLGKLRTSANSEEELDKLNRLLFGSLDFSVASFNTKGNTDKCKIKLLASFSVLEKNLDEALKYVCELLTDTQFDNEEIALNLVRQLATKYFQKIVMAGSSFGATRIYARGSAVGVATEHAGGIEYYKWLRDLEKNWNWEKLSSSLKSLLERVVSNGRLTVSLTSDSNEKLSYACNYLKNNLPESEHQELESVIKKWESGKEGIVIPADISFACSGGMLPDFDVFNGNMSVASKIVSLAYLWNVVRVQGGAYGTGFSISKYGFAFSYSYRDPNANGSLAAYEGIADFLKELCESAPELTGFIIGTVASASPLLMPKTKGARADENYFSGITDEERERMLEEMIKTTPADLLKLAEKIEELYKSPDICVIAGRNQLDKIKVDNIEVL